MKTGLARRRLTVRASPYMAPSFCCGRRITRRGWAYSLKYGRRMRRPYSAFSVFPYGRRMRAGAGHGNCDRELATILEMEQYKHGN